MTRRKTAQEKVNTKIDNLINFLEQLNHEQFFTESY
jgi:hypothetical protein